MFSINHGRRESLRLRGHKLPAGPAREIGACIPFPEHQFLLRMRDDLSRAADQKGEFVGAAAAAFCQADRSHHFANPVQRQVHSRHPDEVIGSIEHRRRKADHANIAGPFVKIGFGNIERARTLRAGVPLLLRVVVVVFHRGQGRPVLAMDRDASTSMP